MSEKLRKILSASLAALMLLTSVPALAQDADGIVVSTAPEPVEDMAGTPEAEDGKGEAQLEPTDLIVEMSRYFVRSGYVRRRKVKYYDNVYCYNHTQYVYTPFSSDVPATYFVVDETGCLAVAPIVLDITDAMRERLYGADVGETALLYGQYCERIRAKDGREGFSGIHEGIDFINEPGCPLYAIWGGTVTRAGDSNGTVGVYNEVYDMTVLYLHCEDIQVRRGDVIEAGTQLGVEGDKKSGSPYTHVEVRFGRHTSSNAYRDVVLQSDLPYEVMQRALNVTDSGRAPVTSAAITRAEEMRRAAEAEAEALAAQQEAEAKAAAEAAAAAAAAADEDIMDEAPEAPEGYGFAQDGADGADDASDAQEDAP